MRKMLDVQSQSSHYSALTRRKARIYFAYGYFFFVIRKTVASLSSERQVQILVTFEVCKEKSTLSALTHFNFFPCF